MTSWGNDERRAHDLVGEGADLALQFFHPVTREPRPVAFRVAERPRADIRHPHVGLAAVAIERSQDRVVGALAPDEPFRRVGMAGLFDPNHPEAGPGEEDDLTRLGVVLAPDVLDIDFPAQVSRSDHDRCSHILRYRSRHERSI